MIIIIIIITVMINNNNDNLELGSNNEIFIYIFTI